MIKKILTLLPAFDLLPQVAPPLTSLLTQILELFLSIVDLLSLISPTPTASQPSLLYGFLLFPDGSPEWAYF